MLKYLSPALWLAPVSFTGEVPTNLSYSFDEKLVKKKHTHKKKSPPKKGLQGKSQKLFATPSRQAGSSGWQAPVPKNWDCRWKIMIKVERISYWNTSFVFFKLIYQKCHWAPEKMEIVLKYDNTMTIIWRRRLRWRWGMPAWSERTRARGETQPSTSSSHRSWQFNL